MRKLFGKTSDREKADRVVTCGQIHYGDRELPTPCIIREMSTLRARLGVEAPEELPSTFRLVIDSEGLVSECEVIDRDSDAVNVRFRSRSFKALTDDGVLPSARLPRPIFGVHDKKTLSNSAPVAGAHKALAGSKQGASEEHYAPILVAEDDPDDRMLLQDAFDQLEAAPPLQFVKDGQELLEYLASNEILRSEAWPRLILLDLNMPRVDGRKALVRIKNNPKWRSIPLVILTTSNAKMDIDKTYGLGASSYIQKPNSFDQMVDMAKMLLKFWTNVAAASPQASDGLKF